MCERVGVGPLGADRAHIASYVRELAERTSRRGANVVSIDSGAGLANATLQQRMVPVRLFYDFLVEEGVRESNPVGRGRYSARNRGGGGYQRGLIPRLTKLPWIPTESQWLELLAVAAGEPARNRVMLALAYDAALRREELCSLRTDDVDPAHRMLRIRGGDDEEPAGTGGALLCAHGDTAVGLSRPPGDAFSSSGVPARIWASESLSKAARRSPAASRNDRSSAISAAFPSAGWATSPTLPACAQPSCSR